jgi:methylated-DNA-[protein]-cysteine S-methyltransferase
MELKHEEALMAMVLDGAAPSPELKSWLATAAGKRELAAYQKALGALNRLYGEARPPELPTVYYSALATPIGKIFVAATDTGLVCVSFAHNEADFAEEMRGQLRARFVKSAEKVAGVAAQLRDYFAGKRRVFDLPLDLRLTTPFQRQVLLAALQIPCGQTLTYAGLAQRIGKPKAARAVGQALGRNPIPIVIPCHRVLASDGSLRGYSGGRGIETKAQLLQLEGAWAR